VLAELALYYWSHTSSPFWSVNFGNGVSQTIRLAWLQTLILQMLASQVARIIDILGLLSFFKFHFLSVSFRTNDNEIRLKEAGLRTSYHAQDFASKRK
jgi:hypothetical protein